MLLDTGKAKQVTGTYRTSYFSHAVKAKRDRAHRPNIVCTHGDRLRSQNRLAHQKTGVNRALKKACPGGVQNKVEFNKPIPFGTTSFRG
jgi:hypothetical protein